MWFALAGLFACTGAPPVLDDTACAEASDRLDKLVCLSRIEDRADWDSVAIDASVVDQDLVAKYMMPSVESAALPRSRSQRRGSRQSRGRLRRWHR